MNENDFEHTMTFVAFLNIDGNRLSSENDELAVFVGNDIRGVTNLVYVQSEDAYFAYLTAFANTSNEQLSFKVYDSSNDVVRDLSTTKTFQTNAHQGDLFQAISFADPQLNTEADILDFDFQGVSEISQNTQGQDITFFLGEPIDVTNLTPIYTISDGSDIFIGTIPQATGTTSMDFSNTVTYRVRSEDQSNLTEWTVTVNSVATDVQFFKKDARCYENGAIRVNSSEQSLAVELRLNGELIATQTMVNGVTTFGNLEANTYSVKVRDILKEIRVRLQSN